MRRSSTVLAPLLASAALSLLAGCHSSEPQRCVDENNHPVDPSFCKNLPGNQPVPGSLGNNGGYYNNGIFFPHFYRYYYGGSILGDMVTGGGYAPTPGHSYSIGGTTRGGFGSSFSSHGSSTGGGE